MCVILQKKYVPLMLMRAYRAAGLCVNMLKDNIEMDIKETALMLTRTENNFINSFSKYRLFHSIYLVESINILCSCSRSESPLCISTVRYRLSMSIYATPTTHSLTL